MADIFREVEEDLRRDKLEDLWEKYGVVVIGAAVGFVALVAAIMFWRDYQVNKQARLSDEFVAATELLETAQTDQAIAAYSAIAETTGSGYKVLSIMQQAAVLSDQGKTQEAVAIYDRLIADGTGDVVLMDLAKIKAAWLLVETASSDDIQARVGDIANSENSWRHSAREVVAYSAVKAGNLDKARQAYKALANDRETPQGIAERAAIMLSVIGPAPVTTPIEAPAAEAAVIAPVEPDSTSDEPATD